MLEVIIMNELINNINKGITNYKASDEVKNKIRELMEKILVVENELEYLVKGNTYGYFFIVDAKFCGDFEQYPGVRDLPFFPRKIAVNQDMLSKMQKVQRERYQIKNMEDEKLITSLKKTKNYLVHGNMLLLALDNGYKLTGVHGYYKFKEDYIFSKYIKENNERKKQATISGNKFVRGFEKDKTNIYPECT